MASMARFQRQGFEKRLGRIKDGGANTMGEVHIGPRDEVRARKGEVHNSVRMKRKKSKKLKAGGGSNSALLPVGMIIGAFSAFVGGAAAFQFFDPRGLVDMGTPLPVLEPYMQYAPYVIAAVLALLFSYTFALTNVVRRLAVIAGMVAAFWFQPLMIHKVPALYVAFFSKQFVIDAGVPLR